MNKLWQVKILPPKGLNKYHCFAVAADTYLQAVNNVIKHSPRLRGRSYEVQEITTGVIRI